MSTTTENSPRWGDLNALQARYPGAFARTRAYQLLAEGKLRAKKLGKRTVWDFASADAMFASLPHIGEGE